MNRFFTNRRKTFAILFAWSAIVGILAWSYCADHENDMLDLARIYARANEIGDVRDRIRVTVPVDAIWKAGAQETRNVSIALGGIWMLGVVAIVLFCRSADIRRLERELAIGSLAKKQEFLNAVLDNIRDGIVACDADGILTLFNPATRQFHGLPVEPLPADQWPQQFDLYLPDGTTLMKKEEVPLYRALRGEKVQNSEMVVAPKNGTPRRLLTDGQQLIVDGTLVGAVVVLHDITEQRKHIEQLAHFAAIVGSLQDAIYAATLDGIVTSWNPGAERLYGYAAVEMVGKSIAVLDPSDRPGEIMSFLSRVKVGERVEIDTVRRRKDGTLVNVFLTWSSIKSSDGEIVGAACIAHDITDRKRAEESLRESEERMANIIHNAAESIYTMSLEGLLTFVSPVWTRLLGHDVSEIEGQPFAQFIHPDDLLECQASIKSVLATGAPQHRTYRIRHKDGSWRWHHTAGSLVKDLQGLPAYFVGVAEDVTERIRSEQELRDYANSLEAANRMIEEEKKAAESASRSKSEFLANMSHEIRTPMTAILGFADILLECSTTTEAIESVQIIKRNGDHLLKVINDILDLAKIEAGRSKVDLQECSPRGVAADVIALMKVRADAKGLPLTLAAPKNTPETIITDPIRLRQILVNLIGNAIKFTEVGSVRIVMRPVPACDGESKLRFDVIDTGIGMSKDEIGLLFRPFSQADNSATRRFGGTGLGLAISNRMAEMLGGDIVVRSTRSQGSTFSLTIGTGRQDGPVVAREASAAFATAQAVANSQSKLECHVLLAEDGPDNRRLIAYLLRKAGAELELAENGEIALDLALAAHQAGNPFDVILMDMQMPVMDGYDATRRLRAAGYTGTIIALTAHAMSGDRQKCIDAGCDDYITKPVDVKKLIGAIEERIAV